LRGRRAASRLAPILLAASGCAPLPDIPAQECGNGVVEAREDCDSLAPGAMPPCRPSGTVGQCHFDCRRGSDGKRPACPASWGCDGDGICRAPTGEFEQRADYQVGGAVSVLAGDFDGDGRADILSRGPPGILGQTKVRFHYFDGSGALSDTRLFPKLLAAPLVTHLAGDAGSDVVFSAAGVGVGVLLGRPDRNLVPESFGSYRIPDAAARLVSVYNEPIQGITSGVLALTTLGGVPGVYVPDGMTGQLRLRARLPGSPEGLVGDPASGDVIIEPQSSPCRELVLAFSGASDFLLVNSCLRAAGRAEVTWRDDFEQRTIALEPAAPIDAAPQLVDVDHDGHLDVLVGAGGRPYVSYGDGQGLAVARPYQLELANPADLGPDGASIAMPLAAGDFSGDGFVDFVFEDHLLISRPPAPGSRLPGYVADQANLNGRWTEAKIADLNGNGKLDVVAALSGSLDIDFFNGTGTEHLNSFRIPTSGRVRHLAIDDYDGDLINDVAFVETPGTDPEAESVSIAFGSLAGPPLAPVAVARLGHIDQLYAFREGQLGSLSAASAETVQGHRNGVLTLFEGSGDRMPFAPYRLTNFSSDGSIEDFPAYGLAAGAFQSPGRRDVLALSTNPQMLWNLWLLSSLDTAGGTSTRLEPGLDPRLQPVSFAPPPDRAAPAPSPEPHLAVASASADLDRDGRDEALWAMPADDERHCGLLVAGTDAGGATLVAHDVVVLDPPCAGAQILPVDVDGDGSIDVALLVGVSGEADRQLLVLWNDGQGHLSSQNVTVVGTGGQSPQGFTALPATAGRPFSFVYVTDQALALVTAVKARELGAPRTLASLPHGSGVTAADVDGDGVLDLVIAAGGDLTVMKAQLQPL
jgi:FG-GAP-like repeat/FG-GAP repeat